MFKNFKFLLFIALGFLMQSCDNMTEEIHINADGSGSYNVYSDMVPMIKSMSQQMSAMGAEEKAEMSEAEVEEMLDRQLWKDMSGEMDSTIDVSAHMPDSIKNRPGMDNLLKKSRVYMKGGKKNGFLKTGFEFSYDNGKDLNEMYMLFNSLQRESNNDFGDMIGDVVVENSFALSKKRFKRKTTVTGKTEEINPQLLRIKNMMPFGKIQTKVYFPRKIKKIKGDFLIEQKDNMAIFEYDMFEYMIGNVDSGFEAEF